MIEDAVAPAGLSVVLLLVEVAGHVGVEVGLQVSELRIIDVILVDLLGDDVEANAVLLLEHDLHLVENEFQLFSLVH